MKNLLSTVAALGLVVLIAANFTTPAHAIDLNNQVQEQNQGQASVNLNQPSQAITFEGSTIPSIPRDPVSTATGSPVGGAGAGNMQCLVPVSAGGQGVGLGLSFGSATQDDGCDTYRSTNLYMEAAGSGNPVAIAIACMNNAKIAEAIAAIEGKDCLGKPITETDQTAAVNYTSPGVTAANEAYASRR